ncbi:MAG: hypothetical protein IPN29_15095 [Saprospiraceae bacterium]|nr:hypothetical protein [Saprospiraceae bacterium]
MARLLLLYNSYSGKGKGKKLAFMAKRNFEQNGHDVFAFENQWPADLSGFDETIICGGDGTLSYFINKYGIPGSPVSILPGGTGNDLHWKLYGPIPIEKQLSNWALYQNRRMDVGVCNGYLFLNTIGLGFDGEVLKSMQAARWIGGHLGYLAIVVRQIFKYKEKRLLLRFGNESIEQECMLCLISNSSRTGGGFMVSPLASIDDGQLNLVYCGRLGILSRLGLLIKVEKGNHLADPRISHHFLREINIRAGEEVFYQLDGELKSAASFEVSLHPEKLIVRAG